MPAVTRLKSNGAIEIDGWILAANTGCFGAGASEPRRLGVVP